MNFGTLFLIVIAGLLGPTLSGFKRFAFPVVMGEICAGIVIGVSGFHLIDPADPMLQFLSSIGFAMLMFLVGTRLPLKNPNLRSVLRHSITATAVAFGVAALFAIVLSKLTSVHSIPMLTLLLACSSSAVVMPMVNERRLEGRVVLLTTTWVIVADITTVVALPMAMYPSKLSGILIGCVLVTGMAVACLMALKMFRLSEYGTHIRQLSKERGWALDLRLSIAILFALTWTALKFGASVLVAGFAAGAVVSAISHPRRFQKQLIGLAEGFFVPLFFVSLGARLDFTAMFQSWHFLLLAGSIVVASVVVHSIVAKAVSLPWASGLMASSQQGLPVALVSLALSEGLLKPGEGAAIIAAAMVLLAVASIGTNRLAKMVPQGAATTKPEPPTRSENDEEDNNNDTD
jgi:Kef-type K+ transport system membrane component KefB